MRSRDDDITFLKRKSYPAVLPWREQGDLLTLYFGCYIADEAFTTALIGLAEDNRDAIGCVDVAAHWWNLKAAQRRKALPPDVERYTNNLGAFVKDWKLDCLSQQRGYQAVMWWCWLKCRNLSLPAESFISSATVGGMVPSVGEKVVTKTMLRDMEGTEFEYEGYDIRPPTIHITLESPWEAQYESPAAIYERLMRECSEQIAVQLKRWCQEYLAVGYIFQDTKTEPGKYAAWTYRRIGGEHFEDIAEKEFVAAESVRLRTNEFAKAIGLSLPRTRRRVHE